jgi:hypothetical protein
MVKRNVKLSRTGVTHAHDDAATTLCGRSITDVENLWIVASEVTCKTCLKASEAQPTVEGPEKAPESYTRQELDRAARRKGFIPAS